MGTIPIISLIQLYISLQFRNRTIPKIINQIKIHIFARITGITVEKGGPETRLNLLNGSQPADDGTLTIVYS